MKSIRGWPNRFTRLSPRRSGKLTKIYTQAGAQAHAFPWLLKRVEDALMTGDLAVWTRAESPHSRHILALFLRAGPFEAALAAEGLFVPETFESFKV